jgi:ankyrin repeat protein
MAGKNVANSSVLTTAILKEAQGLIPLIIGALHDELNAQYQNDCTALHVAAQTENVDAVSQLLNAGALAEVPAKDGWTPPHFAIFLQSEEIARAFAGAVASPWAKTQGGRIAIDPCKD